jgi:hypothetical protein
MGDSLAGLEGHGILYIGWSLSISAESNIFSLQRVILATVPSGEPPPEETRNTSRPVSWSGESAGAAKPLRVRRLWRIRRRGSCSPIVAGEWRQGKNMPASGAAGLSSSLILYLKPDTARPAFGKRQGRNGLFGHESPL